jgi:branched-chain amino acid transport system substrate-binding protein
MSGFMAAAGSNLVDACKLAIKEINESGGVLGRQLELVVEDCGSDAGRANAAFTKLIEQEHVDGLMGPIWGNEVASVQAMVERAKQVDLITSTPQMSTQDLGYKYSYMLATSGLITAQGYWAEAQYMNVKKIVAIANDEAFMQDTIDQFQKLIPPGQGYEFVRMTDTFTAGDVNLESQATKMKQEVDRIGADALCIATDGISAIPLLQSLAKLGVDLPIIAGDSFADPAVVEAGGELVEDVYFASMKNVGFDTIPDADPDKQSMAKYVDAFKTLNGYEPSSFAHLTYTAIYMYKDAWEAVGSTDYEKVREYLDTKRDYTFITGTYNWADTHNGPTIQGQAVFVIAGGQFVWVANISPDITPVDLNGNLVSVSNPVKQ